MVAFRQSVTPFSVLVMGIILAGTIGGICCTKQKTTKNIFCKFEIKWEYVILFLTVIIICGFMLLYYRSDADDSFYVSNVLLFSKSNRLNPYDSSFGNSSFGTVPMYDFQIWESYLAVLCRIFSIRASVMCHFVMVFVLLIVAISSLLLLGDTLFENDQQSALFVWALLLIYCMGGYAVYTKGSFLLSRIWQGKAVYLHIVLPVAIVIMLLYLKEQRKTQGLLLGAVMLTGIALNPTSMYVMGFQILFMMVTIILYTKQWKGLLHILPTVVIIAGFSLFLLLRTHNYNGQIEAASSVPEHFAYNTFLNFFGEGKIVFYVYIICCVFILLRGEIKGKILCVYTPLLLFAGVWNSYMAPVIAQYLTMVPSYWRVFWLLPTDFALAYCMVKLSYNQKKNYYKVAFCIGFIAVVLWQGKFMFSANNNFVKAENKERIPSEILYLGDIIAANEKEKQIVLACDKGATTLRQEYNSIELIYSRYQYILDLIMYRDKEQEANERIALMQFVNGTNPELDCSYVTDLLSKYEVEWIMIEEGQSTSIELLQSIGYIETNEKNKMLLLHNET